MLLEMIGKQAGRAPRTSNSWGGSLLSGNGQSFAGILERNQSWMSDETWTVHRSSDAFFSPLQSATWLGRPAALRELWVPNGLATKGLRKEPTKKGSDIASPNCRCRFGGPCVCYVPVQISGKLASIAGALRGDPKVGDHVIAANNHPSA